MDWTVLGIFLFVYVGMVIGNVPGLAIDRTGIALLGAIALLATRQMNTAGAWEAIDVPTVALLFGLMVISAQFRLAGFYTHVTRRLSSMELSPGGLLALLIAVVAVLSAVLANDIVCLAVTPVLVEGCARRNLDPVPFLLALACASNVGSAATLIGNPQNMLIGQRLHLSFTHYLFDASLPVFLGLCSIWWVIWLRFRGKWGRSTVPVQIEAPEPDFWQAAKGLLVISFLIAAFLTNYWPRDVLALAAAGFLLLSRKMASRRILGLVDWQLLVLFGGLFVVNHAIIDSGIFAKMSRALGQWGVNPGSAGWLFVITVLLSNLVSNVPATMLLLPAASHPMAGPILALASTFAGNLLLVGSIANLIVVDQAERVNPDLRLTWIEHARVGIPVTLLSLSFAAAWLWYRSSGS
jgi:Na+/H+ antiporter NhaD/arsenite permease-like protein